MTGWAEESPDPGRRVARFLESHDVDEWETMLAAEPELAGSAGRSAAVGVLRTSLATSLDDGLAHVAAYLFLTVAAHSGLAPTLAVWATLADADVGVVFQRMWTVYEAPTAADADPLDLALLGGGALLASSVLARLDRDSLVAWLSAVSFGLIERSRRLGDEPDADLAAALLEPVRGADVDQEASRLDHLARALGRLGELGDPAQEARAMSLHRQAVDLPVTDPALGATLRNNLAVALARTFDATGDEALLVDEAATYREILDLVDEADRDTVRRNLAGVLVRGIDLFGWDTLAEASALVDTFLDRITGTDLPVRVEAMYISRALVVARHRLDAALDNPRLDDVLRATRRLLGVLPPHSPETVELTINVLPVLGELWEHLGDRRARDGATALAMVLVADLPMGAHERRAALANAGIALADAGDPVAVETFRAAVEAAPPGTALRARALDNLAHTLSERWRTSGDEGALHEAEASYRQALELLSERAGHRPTLLSNAAGTDLRLYDHTGRVTHLDRAVDRYRQALALTDRGARSWPARAGNLASALLARTTQHGGLHHLYEAVPLARKAVDVCSPGAIYRPSLLNVLAQSLRRAAATTPESEVFAEALDMFEQAVGASPDPGPDRSGRLDNYADALAERGVRDSEVALIDRAVALREQAIAELDPGAPVRRAIESNLAATLLTRWRLGGGDDDVAVDLDLDRATALARSSAGAAGGEDRPTRLAVLGLALASGGLVDEAGATFAEACRTGIGTQPGTVLSVAQLWGDHALRRQRYEEAATAYGHARDAMRLLVTRQQTRAPKEEWLADTQDLASGAFCALAAAGRATEAAQAAEEARALLLVDALSAGGADLAMAGAPVVAPRGAALYLAAGHDGGWAVVRTATSDEQVFLPGLSREAVGSVVDRHLALARDLIAGGRSARRTWQEHLRDLVAWLGSQVEAAMGPSVVHLQGADDLVFVPLGSLALLPWNAASLPSATEEGPQWIDSLVTVRYAPSLWSLALLPTTFAPPAGARPPLVVASPTPSRLPDLEPEPEIEAVLGAFPGAEVLRGDGATVAAIAEAIAGRQLAHVVAHGHVEPLEPSRSGFYAAHDHLFTVQLLVERGASAPALVVLSGCQTALVGRRLPDESIGLPAAFLQAGARGVVAAQWPVTNATAATFMRAFYAALPGSSSPAAALRQAQQDVRRTQLSTGPLTGAHPFTNPDHWAPFTYWGV